MTHTISKEILRPICEKLHEANNDFPFHIYSDPYKAKMYRDVTVIIKEYENQKCRIKEKENDVQA